MKTITLIVNTKYRETGFKSANLNYSIRMMDIKIPVMAINPAFNPSTSTSNKNAASGVSGITNSVNSTLEGSANLEILPAAFIEKSIKMIIETPLAYFFNFGNFRLIPRARIAPCNRPTANTTAKV